MRRKILSAILTILFLGAVDFAQAQQPKKVPRIGYLSAFDAAGESARSEAIRVALRELGYIEGQSIAIEYRYSEGKQDRQPELAAELVRLKVDLIVVAGAEGTIRAAMNRKEWRQELGELVRNAMRSPELDHYFKVKITKPGAQVLITQLGLFIHHRRDCWAHVSGNCPHMSVKQKILQHEYGEVIKDEYTEHGHMELIIRQGKALGLSPKEVLEVEPLPTTRATLYAWGWMTREKNWLEGLASLTITEWANDDRLLQDLGGGLSSRMAKRWMEDLGFGWEQMPNFKVHSQADEEHSDMFLDDLEKFATGEKEALAYQAAKESMV